MKIGAKIHKYKTCTSTNDVAKEMALAGEEEGTVVVSDEQTKGRGTKGRSWYSARKKGLYLSSILYPSQPRISLLPLAAGLAANDAIFESTGIRVGLKWPNDLVWGKKKLGGILCESGFLGNKASYAIVGIGINLNHEREDFPEEIRPMATSVKLIMKKNIDRERLIQKLCKALNRWYVLFRERRNEEIVRSFQDYSILALGKEVKLLTETEEVFGKYAGIDSKGGLVLESQGKRKSFFSGEVRIIKGVRNERF
jgi:BirA family biotin operon repressor/biotin-[acetyl-CoA-carboxylase] ligase